MRSRHIALAARAAIACLALATSSCALNSLPPEDRVAIINATIGAVINGAVRVATEDVQPQLPQWQNSCRVETSKLADYIYAYDGWWKLIPVCRELSQQGGPRIATSQQAVPEASFLQTSKDRADIYARTLKPGIDALSRRALVESACVTQAPSLWPAAPFTPTFRPEARAGTIASGIIPPDGPGMLRVGANGCYEQLTLVPGDPGNAWVPYTGSATNLVSANYYARYGWGAWAGHSHGVDSEVCSPVVWYLELEGRRLNCGDMAVIDTWYNRGLFYGLWTRYKALVTPSVNPPVGPSAPPVAPPVVPPITPPAAVCPEGQACRPEPVPCQICETCKVCETCKTCEVCSPLPTLALIPSDVLATASHAAEWVMDQTASNKAKKKKALDRVAALHRLHDWLKSQSACEAVKFNSSLAGDLK